MTLVSYYNVVPDISIWFLKLYVKVLIVFYLFLILYCVYAILILWKKGVCIMIESPLTLYKLIILYMLNKVTFPLSNSQISEFVLGAEYTDYFHLQQALNDLRDSGLVTTQRVRNTTNYHMTEKGLDTLEFFKGEISNDIKADIDTYLKANAYELRNESSTQADYYKTTSHEFEVHCTVTEQTEKLIEVVLTVPTKEAAEDICDNWSGKSQEVYAFLMKTLMN